MLLRAIIFSAVVISAILIGYFILVGNEKLPVYSPDQLNPKLVDESLRKKDEHRISAFSLTDQLGRTITEKDLKGKIYIADFFFTTCEGICLDMSLNMARIQEEFEDEEDLMLLSHSVTPEIDSVPALRAYGDIHGANNDRWLLLTGDRNHIYNLARKEYFAAKHDGDGGPNDMVHTENFVLVDKEKRIRGFYDGTAVEDIDRAIDDIEVLLAEYDQ